MKHYVLIVALLLSACGGSNPGEQDPPDAGVGVPDSGIMRDCQTDADCDDGVDCTTEICGEDDKCEYTADHAACDNGDMCDGMEQCMIDLGCRSVDPPPPARECRQDVQPQVVLGEYHTCAIDPLGYLYCWGYNNNGQLGYGEFGPDANIGETSDRLPSLVGPVSTPNGESAPVRYVVGVTLGVTHTCALLNSGDVLCWGSHREGQLGYGDLGDNNIDEEYPKLAAPLATPLDLGGKAVQIAGTHSYHTCALLDGGKVRCWGIARDGELGYPVAEPGDGGPDSAIIIGDDETPASAGDVDVGGTVVQIAVGGQHTCALLDDGNVRCWGNGARGQLGRGSSSDVGDQQPPSAAGNIDVGGPVTQITAGGSHTCALLEGGSVRCWGSNDNGQLGYGQSTFGENYGDQSGETPAAIGDIPLGERPGDGGGEPVPNKAVQIAAGGLHTCVLLDHGGVRCWGDGSRGALGYGNTTDIRNQTPAELEDINLGGKAVQIAAGGFHTCAVLDTGALRCWGHNTSGQLGYGNANTIGDSEAPASAGDVPLGVALIE